MVVTPIYLELLLLQQKDTRAVTLLQLVDLFELRDGVVSHLLLFSALKLGLNLLLEPLAALARGCCVVAISPIDDAGCHGHGLCVHGLAAMLRLHLLRLLLRLSEVLLAHLEVLHEIRRLDRP